MVHRRARCGLGHGELGSEMNPVPAGVLLGTFSAHFGELEGSVVTGSFAMQTRLRPQMHRECPADETASAATLDGPDDDDFGPVARPGADSGCGHRS